jgi:hypothetical protein
MHIAGGYGIGTQRIIGYEGFRVGDSTLRSNKSQSLASVMLPAVIIPSPGISEGSHIVHIVSAQCAQSDSLPAPWLLALAALAQLLRRLKSLGRQLQRSAYSGITNER